MRKVILNLDGSIAKQPPILTGATSLDYLESGKYLRLGCSFSNFSRFAKSLNMQLDELNGPNITFLGSGDFHHLSLALLQRINEPFNLLILDNHSDWVKGIPFLHCGSWLSHALKLDNLKSTYHVGGNIYFDNFMKTLAPWSALESGKLKVFSGDRRFVSGRWEKVENSPIRSAPGAIADEDRILSLFRPFAHDIGSLPLYISFDKDVLRAEDAIVNWDSGVLSWQELKIVIKTFCQLADHKIIGADTVGDWAEMNILNLSKWIMHKMGRPPLKLETHMADAVNQKLNLEFLACFS
jgi:hypothetical protein